MQEKDQSSSSQPIHQRIKHYSFSHSSFLGKGNFAQVYRGINQLTNEPVAIKVKDLNSLNNDKLKQLHAEEIQILPRLNHPNIVTTFDVIQEGNYCYIVSELCQGGDLDMFVKKKGVLTEEQAAHFLKDILEGMLYLSSLNVVHRDLKVANVFISGNTAKIADFGFSKVSRSNFIDVNIGSPLYMAPQAFKHSIYGSKTDVWSFGILMFELIHGDTPYGSYMREQDLIRQLSMPFNRSKVKQTTSKNYRDTMFMCLQIQASQRISFEELKSTQYFKRIYSDSSSNDIGKQGLLRVNYLHPGQIERERSKSIQRLYPSGSGTNLKVTFHNIKDHAPQERSSPQVQTNNTRPPGYNTLYPNNQNIPKPFRPNNQNQPRPNTFVRLARPISNEKQASNLLTLSPQSPRVRIVSIDSRKPVNNIRLFTPILTFKIAVNILHYCRCLYRYIQLLISAGESQKQLKFSVDWLMLLLEELKRKTNDCEITFEGVNKAIKMQKFREVRTDYERKYTNQFKRYISNFRTKPNLEQVKNFLSMEYRKYDYHISKEPKDIFIEIGVYSILLFDSTRLLKKCQDIKDFNRYATYKQLEDMLLIAKQQFSHQTYNDIKRRILV